MRRYSRASEHAAFEFDVVVDGMGGDPTEVRRVRLDRDQAIIVLPKLSQGFDRYGQPAPPARTEFEHYELVAGVEYGFKHVDVLEVFLIHVGHPGTYIAGRKVIRVDSEESFLAELGTKEGLPVQ